MSRDVVIAGVGLTRHVAYDVERSWKEMLADAIFQAIDDCGLEPSGLGGGIVAFHGEAMAETGNIGPIVADGVGMDPSGVTGISGACAGGAMALYHAYALVASGLCDTVFAAGFEKGSELYEYLEAITPSSEADYDYTFGLTHLDWLALISWRYARKYGLENWDCAVRWISDRHWFARRHPKSFYAGQAMPSMKEIERNKLYWASARADGAAAVVVTTRENAERLGRSAVDLSGIGYASASAYLPHRFHHDWSAPESDIGDSPVSAAAARSAFAMAKLEDVETADILQVSDASPGMSFAELEAIGLYSPGTAWKAVLEGEHGFEGRYPTNTHGGSIAFGHASGSSALVNVIETVTQMRGEAEERQVKGPPVLGVCQSSGGSNSNNAVVVLRGGENV